MEEAYFKKLRINNINKILLFILIIIFSLTVGLYLSKQETTTFFLLGPLGNIKSSLNNSNGLHIEPYESAPGYSMMLFLLHKICGVSIIDVAFLPVGILITPIVYFVLVKRIFNDNIIAIGSAFYIIFEIAQTGWYNTFVYTFSRPLYLLCILLCIYIIKEGKRIKFMIPLLILFVGVTFIHYTVPVWIISFLLAIYFISKVEKNDKMSHWLTTIFLFVVIYLSFNQIFYKVFVPSFVNMLYESGYYEPITDIWLQIKSFAFGQDIILEKYGYYPSRGLLGSFRLLLNFIILIPIILTLPKIVKKFWKSIKNRNKKPGYRFDMKFYIYCAFLVTIPIQAFIYGTVFHISNQFIMFLGVPIALMALRLLKTKKKVMVLFLAVIIVVSAITFLYNLSYIEKNPKYSVTKPSADWLFNNTDQEAEPIILSSINKLYYYNFIGIDYNKSIRFSYFSSTTYDRVVSQNYSEINRFVDYVVIDKYIYSNGVSGEHLKHFEPLSNYDEEININPNLDKVYNDGNVWIFKT